MPSYFLIGNFMTLKGQNFEVYQGDDHEIVILVKDSDGNPADLTGYTGVWAAYNQTTAQVVLSKISGSGLEIPTPANGQVVITLSQEDTDDLAPKNYGHQCELEDPSGNHSTVCEGYMKVLRSVTHSLL